MPVAEMPDTQNPSPRRKSRAAMVIVAIVLVLVVVTFVGRNVFYLREDVEGSEPVQTN
jgi:hypothetical protein